MALTVIGEDLKSIVEAFDRAESKIDRALLIHQLTHNTVKSNGGI